LAVIADSNRFLSGIYTDPSIGIPTLIVAGVFPDGNFVAEDAATDGKNGSLVLSRRARSTGVAVA
jgi:hypothetical protein